MDQHSPAPWQPSDHSGGAAIADARGYRIASLAYGSNSVSMKIGIDEANANHRLMLAAPALRAACIRLLTTVGLNQDDTDPEDYAAIDEARSALALAEPGLVPS